MMEIVIGMHAFASEAMERRGISVGIGRTEAPSPPHLDALAAGAPFLLGQCSLNGETIRETTDTSELTTDRYC